MRIDVIYDPNDKTYDIYDEFGMCCLTRKNIKTLIKVIRDNDPDLLLIK